MISLNIRIPDELASRLLSLSEQTGRTKSYYVRAALEEKYKRWKTIFLPWNLQRKFRQGNQKFGLKLTQKMKLAYRVEWSDDAVKQLRKLDKLDKKVQRNVIDYLKNRVMKCRV